MTCKLCLVTVGTTKFDALIERIDSDDFELCLISLGFTHLRIQLGKGDYIPKKVLSSVEERSGGNEMQGKKGGKLYCDYYRLKPSLKPDLEMAGLVIGHGGKR